MEHNAPVPDAEAVARASMSELRRFDVREDGRLPRIRRAGKGMLVLFEEAVRVEANLRRMIVELGGTPPPGNPI
jgi:hypothetical protein